MAIRTREEIMSSINTRFEGDTSDETLTFIEDIADTLNSYENSINTDWEKKYNDLNAEYQNLDNSWRQRYRERFFDSSPDNTTTTAETIVEDNKEDLISESKDKSFDELFTERSESSGY